MRTHTGEMPFKCRFCERKFYDSANFRRHLRSHTGENARAAKEDSLTTDDCGGSDDDEFCCEIGDTEVYSTLQGQADSSDDEPEIIAEFSTKSDLKDSVEFNLKEEGNSSSENEIEVISE